MSIKKILKLDGLSGNKPYQYLVLWMCAAVWSPFILSGVIVATLFGFIMIKKPLRNVVVRQKELFYLACCISLLSLASSLISANYIGMVISCGIFIVIVLGSYVVGVMDSELHEKACVFLGYGSVLGFLVAVVQKMVIYREYADYRPQSVAFNPNYYGTLAAMTAVLMLVKLLDGEGTTENHVWYKPTKFFYGIVLAVNIGGVFISRSRSSLMALMACVLIYLFLSKRYKICAAGIVAAAAVCVLGFLNPDVFRWQNSILFIFTERKIIWFDALKSFSQNIYTALIGRGPMTYRMVWESEGLYGANHAHNLVADILINVGITGLILYAFLFAYFINNALMARKTNNLGFILGLLMLAGVLIQGIPDITIMWYQTVILFFVMYSAVSITQTNKITLYR